VIATHGRSLYVIDDLTPVRDVDHATASNSLYLYSPADPVRRVTDAAQNIRGGMAYLRWLLAYFEGDLALALAGYNAGERAVERYRGIPPYAETRLYVSRIIAALGGRRSHAFDPTVTPPSDVMIVLRGARRLR